MSATALVSPAWKELVERHPDHRCLGIDPLYALDPKLTEALLQEAILSEPEAQFERALAECSCGGGFYHQQPFEDPLPIERPTRSQDPPSTRGAIDKAIDKAFDPFASEPIEGTWPGQFNFTSERQRAYVAWLICNKEFRTERDSLQTVWGGWVDRIGYFPRDSDELDQGQDPQPTQTLKDFYRRWCLSTLTTWDLPLPTCPGFRSCDRPTVNVPGPGVTIFVPWYILRDKQLDLHEIVEGVLRSNGLAHLANWLGSASQEDRRRKYAGLERQYFLYVYWRLGLKRRYGDLLRRKTEKLDHAFAEYLGDEYETVRKLRLDLQKKLT